MEPRSTKSTLRGVRGPPCERGPTRLVIQKIFRGIDRALLEQSGSIVDAIHRAEKRGLCDARKMREIRELRNIIAHEYSIEDLRELFKQVYQLTEDLLVIFERTEEFVRKTGTF